MWKSKLGYLKKFHFEEVGAWGKVLFLSILYFGLLIHDELFNTRKETGDYEFTWLNLWGHCLYKVL